MLSSREKCKHSREVEDVAKRIHSRATDIERGKLMGWLVRQVRRISYLGTIRYGTEESQSELTNCMTEVEYWIDFFTVVLFRSTEERNITFGDR